MYLVYSCFSLQLCYLQLQLLNQGSLLCQVILQLLLGCCIPLLGVLV